MPRPSWHHCLCAIVTTTTAIAPVDTADLLAGSCLGDLSTRAREMRLEGKELSCDRPVDSPRRVMSSFRNFAAQFQTWCAEQPRLSANFAALSPLARHSAILSRHSLAFAMPANLHHPITARKTGSVQRIREKCPLPCGSRRRTVPRKSVEWSRRPTRRKSGGGIWGKPNASGPSGSCHCAR